MAVRIGDRGQALGALRPSGQVRIEGDSYPARCTSGWVGPDVEVVVIGAESFGLVVRPMDADQPTAGVGEEVWPPRRAASPPEHAGLFRVIWQEEPLLLGCLAAAGAAVAVGFWHGGLPGALVGLAVGTVSLLLLVFR